MVPRTMNLILEGQDTIMEKKKKERMERKETEIVEVSDCTVTYFYVG